MSDGTARPVSSCTTSEEANGRTIMLEELVLIAALPEDTALLRPHHLPRAKIDGSFVGRILEKSSVTQEKTGSDK